MHRGQPRIIVGTLAGVFALAGLVSAGLAVDPAEDRQGCPVLRDLPYYQVRPDGVAPMAADRHIPARAPVQDPCALRLLR